MELRKKFLLINPPSGAIIREDRCQTPIDDLRTVALRPPIDLMYIAGALEQAGCECKIIDYPAIHKTWEHFKEDIESFSPDVLVISATTPSLKKDMIAVDVAKKIKPHIMTIAKGAHFNLLDIDTLEKFPNLDLVTRGEYELTFKEIGEGKDLASIKGITYRDYEGKIIRNPNREFCETIDLFPFPTRHLIDNKLYRRPDTDEPQTTIVTNRGCPCCCAFCLSGQVAGVKNRIRSVKNIIDELEESVTKHNITNFLFRSDLFTADKKWVKELCNEIINRKLKIKWACNSRVDTIDEELLAVMKKAGCWMIAYGVESGNEEILKKIGKRITLEKAQNAIRITQKAGIKASVYFLIGLPWDNEQTLADSINFAKKANPNIVEFFFLYPFPGTKIYDIAVEEKLIEPGEIPVSAYSKPAMPTLYLTEAQLFNWRKKSLKSFYLRPIFIIRTFAGVRSARELKNYIKYGFIQISDFMRRRRK